MASQSKKRIGKEKTVTSLRHQRNTNDPSSLQMLPLPSLQQQQQQQSPVIINSQKLRFESLKSPTATMPAATGGGTIQQKDTTTTTTTVAELRHYKGVGGGGGGIPKTLIKAIKNFLNNLP